MAAEEGDGFEPQACNLAEFCRRTGLTRSRARTIGAHGFRALPHGNNGRKAAPGVLDGHTGLVDDLRKSVTNSQVIFERLLGQDYAGGLTTAKTYIAAHRVSTTLRPSMPVSVTERSFTNSMSDMRQSSNRRCSACGRPWRAVGSSPCPAAPRGRPAVRDAGMRPTAPARGSGLQRPPWPGATRTHFLRTSRWWP